MTPRLHDAIAQLEQMSATDQDEIASVILRLAGIEVEDDLVDIDPADMAAVQEGLGQARRGEFATEAEVRAAFSRFST